MSQTFTDDIYNSGRVADTMFADMENNFAALKTAFSGASSPPNPTAGMWWADTTNHILKIRNEANNTWIDVIDLATGKLAADSVVTDSLVDLCATTAKFADGTLQTDDFADGAVTGDKLA